MNDKLVAIPTETVYGLACNALSPAAAELVFRTKARPLTDPLIVHVASPSSALPLISAPTSLLHTFTTLTSKFWPGPLTIILPSSPLVPSIITSNTSTVALRSPSHPVCRSILSSSKVPLAMPSANKFGHVSPTTSLHVMGEFPSDDVLIVEDEGGREEDRVGIESTVVKLTEGGGGEVGVQVLRPGAVTRSMIEGCLKEGGIEYEVKEPPRKALGEDEESNGAPGQNVKHYAPTVPAFIWKGGEGGMEQLESTVVIDFGAERAGLQGRALGYRTLSPGGDAREAGRLIYETLRWAEGVEGAKWIALPDLRGVEDERVEGVRDRIWRAASGVVKGGEKV